MIAFILGARLYHHTFRTSYIPLINLDEHSSSLRRTTPVNIKLTPQHAPLALKEYVCIYALNFFV